MTGHYLGNSNDLRPISRRNDLEVRGEEQKIPKLQEVIDKWKFEVQTENMNLDQSLILSVNSDDDRDVTLRLLRFLSIT